MKRYEVIEEAYQGDTRYVLSEIVGGSTPRYELTAYDPHDPQGGYRAERAVYTTLKDAKAAMVNLGVVPIEVSVPLYDQAQYTSEIPDRDEVFEVMGVVA